MTRRTVGAAIGLALLALPACSKVAVTKTLDASRTAGRISANLATAFSIPPPAVSCPSGVRVQAGRQFTCATTIDSQPLSISVVLDGQGQFTPQAQQAVIELGKVRAELQAGDAAAVVRCDVAHPTLLVAPVGATFTCTVDSASGAATYRVTVKDLKGTVGFDQLPPT